MHGLSSTGKEDNFRAKAQKSVFMRKDESRNLIEQDHQKEFSE